MHFDFVFMHHLLGPCVMQLTSRFNRRFGVIKHTLLSRPRRNKNHGQHVVELQSWPS